MIENRLVCVRVPGYPGVWEIKEKKSNGREVVLRSVETGEVVTLYEVHTFSAPVSERKRVGRMN